MKKEILSSVPADSKGIDYNVSFPLFCKGEARDAFTVSNGKSNFKAIKEQPRAVLYPIESSSADEFVKRTIVQHASLLGGNTYQQTSISLYWYIKLIGGFRHSSSNRDADISYYKTEFLQFWNHAQQLFVEDPAMFLDELKITLNMSNLLRSGSSYAYAVRERDDNVDSDFATNLLTSTNKYLSYVVNDGASGVFFQSFPYQVNLSLFDLFDALSDNIVHKVTAPFSSREIDTFNKYGFNYYKLFDYGNRDLSSHDQLTAAGQFTKVISNRTASQSIVPETSKAFDFGRVSDLFYSKSVHIDQLSDAFSKLLSSNYRTSYRGIFSGALFLQADDFSTTFGNRETVYLEGYINLIKQFCGGDDFEKSFVIIDLNRVAENKDYLYTHSEYHSLAREFALVNIHTLQSYLVSIGEHRFNGQNLWRHDRRDKLSRMPSNDLTTDSLCLNNNLLTDLDSAFRDREHLASAARSAPMPTKSAVNHLFATRIGRGITSIYGIEYSSCIAGASVVHSPFSGLIHESADDDKDTIQYDLDHVSLLDSKKVRNYELLKAKEQKQFMIGIFADLLRSKKNLIYNVFNFNLAVAKFKPGSSYNNPAKWNAQKAIVLASADRYHYTMWLALYAIDSDFETSGPNFDSKPARMRAAITEILVTRGLSKETVRSPETVFEAYNSIMLLLMSVANELDLNHDSNVIISQNLKKYVYYDGSVEYLAKKFEASDPLFISYIGLNMHVFLNLGDEIKLSSNYEGLPVWNDGPLPIQINPHTLPMLGDDFLYWNRHVNADYCNLLAEEFVIADYRHNGRDDNRNDAYYDRRHGSSLTRKHDELLVLDIDPLLHNLNNIVSLPVIFLSLMKENESEYYLPTNPLFSHALSLYGTHKFGNGTGEDWIDDKPQSEFYFDLDSSGVRNKSSLDVLTYLSNYFGVVNMNGATGHYLSTITGIKFDINGERVFDKNPIYLRDLACAIHKDTGKIPCTSKMISVLLEVNQKLLDIEFNYMSGLAGVNFTNDEKLDIINKAKPFVDAAFKRSTALFLYENYK